MKFKTANDDLRKEDSQFYNFGTAIEREKQLIDKRRNYEQKMLEEQIYSQLWALDGQKKLEREIQEQEEKKQKIYQAALEEFVEHGYQNASTNRITQRAGISKGLLFHYFKNKKNSGAVNTMRARLKEVQH